MMVALIGVLKEHRNLPADRLRAGRAGPLDRARASWASRAAARTSTRRPSAASTSSSCTADRVVVNPLRVAPDVMLELEHNLLLCYTGTTRQGDHIIEDQTARFEAAQRGRAWPACAAQKELAVEMKNALLQRRLRDFGELLDTAWEAKKRMSDADLQPAHRRALRRGAAAPARSAARSPARAAAATCCSTAATTASTRWPSG